MRWPEACVATTNVPAACAIAESPYRRREPEKSVLHRVLMEHLNTFFATHDLPRHVRRTLRGYVDCGVLAKGFVRVRCPDCKQESLVAFSCKDRSFCPSCTARRAADTAAHLVDEVLPHVPMRQWVLALPPDLHARVARDPELEGKLLRMFAVEIERLLRITTRAGDVGRGGNVTFLQHFGSSLNLHVHPSTGSGHASTRSPWTACTCRATHPTPSRSSFPPGSRPRLKCIGFASASPSERDG